MAAEHGHTSNVSILLQHNADISARDSNGMTPIDLADKCAHVKCVMILKNAAGKIIPLLKKSIK